MKISHDVIRRLGACWDGRDWRNAFGDLIEVDVTATNARKFAGKINWNWLSAELLTSEGHNKFIELVERACDRYYQERTRIREENPYPTGTLYRDCESAEIHPLRTRLLDAVQDEFDRAYADAFFVVYVDERERVDSIIEWASSDSKEVGPHGAKQYIYDHNEDDDDPEDYEDDVITGSVYDG